jgi:hypothetical protein
MHLEALYIIHMYVGLILFTTETTGMCSEHLYLCYLIGLGHAIAQAVSRWIPIAAARVRARVCSYGICSEQNGAKASFLRGFRFPLPILIPPIAP